jgi:hypothetical protein
MLNRFFQMAASTTALVITFASCAMSSSLVIPSKDSFSADEYQAIEHYHNSFIGKKTCPVTEKLNNVQDKKDYLIDCLGENHQGLKKYLALSNSFWTKFNTNQILFLASMYGVYPNLEVGKDKQTEVLNKKTGFYTIKSKDSNGKELDMDTFDCIRTNVALASLAHSSTYAGLKNEYLYTRQATIGTYTTLVKDFIDAFKVQLPNFTQIGYKPLVNQGISSSSAKKLTQVGDVIYINSLRIGFKTWDEQRSYDSKVFTATVLKQLVLDMKYSNIKTTKELSKTTLDAAIRAAYAKNSEENSDNDKELIVQGSLTMVNKLLAKDLTSIEINSYVQLLDKELDAIDTQVDVAESKIKMFSTTGNPIKPGSVNFHVVTVLDIHNGVIKVAQMDGSQPLQAMSIANWNSRINDNDRLAILRGK